MASKFLDKVLIYMATRENYTEEEQKKISSELRKESDELLRGDYTL